MIWTSFPPFSLRMATNHVIPHPQVYARVNCRRSSRSKRGGWSTNDRSRLSDQLILQPKIGMLRRSYRVHAPVYFTAFRQYIRSELFRGFAYSRRNEVCKLLGCFSGVFALGFAVGYGLRERKSRMRRSALLARSFRTFKCARHRRPDHQNQDG